MEVFLLGVHRWDAVRCGTGMGGEDVRMFFVCIYTGTGWLM